VVCGEYTTFEDDRSDLVSSLFLKIWLNTEKMARILESKEDPATVVVRPHIDVNLSGNYVKLNFLSLVVEITVVLSTQYIYF
jgi:hypothetical protein